MNRALCLSLLVAATLLPAASGAPERRISVGAGVSVVVPRGWHLSRSPGGDLARRALLRLLNSVRVAAPR